MSLHVLMHEERQERQCDLFYNVFQTLEANSIAPSKDTK